MYVVNNNICTDYPFLNFINNILDVRNTEIHISVEQKPMYTEGSVIGQPRANIDLIDSVDCVNGKMKLIDFITTCIPSTGHIMPINVIKLVIFKFDYFFFFLSRFNMYVNKH